MKNINFIILIIIIGILSFSVAKNLSSIKDSDIQTFSDKRNKPLVARAVSSIAPKTVSNEEKKIKKHKTLDDLITKDHHKVPNNRIKKLLSKHKLEKFYNDLGPAFPNTEIGQELLELTTFLEWHEISGTQESNLVDKLIEKLQERPEETIEALGKVFENLPNKFSNEKQRLMQFASTLDADENLKIDLFVTEINRPFVRNEEGPNKNFALFNTSLAFRSLANVIGQESQRLEPYIRDALHSHQNDSETQRVLIHYFGRYDSLVADQLKIEYEINQ